MADRFDAAIDGMLGSQLDDSARTAKGSVATVIGDNPDETLKLQRAARNLGIPIDSARTDPKRVHLEASVEATDWTGMAQRAPKTARFLGDTSKAAIAHDDIGILEQAEQTFKATIGTLSGFIGGLAGYNTREVATSTDAKLRRAPSNTGRAFLAGGQQASAGLVGMVEGAFDNPIAADYQRRTGKELPINAWLHRYRSYIQAGEKAMTPKTGNPTADAALQGVKSIPGSVTGAGISLASGNPATGLAFMGAITAGSAYTQAKDQGLDPTSAKMFAANQGLVEVATEALPVGSLLKDLKAGAPFAKVLFHQLIEELPGEQVATVVQDFNEWLVLPQNKDKTLGDYIAARPGAAMDTLIATLTGTGGNVVLTSAVSHVANAANGAKVAAREEARAAHAQNMADTIGKLGQVAAASKLRERDSETFKQFIADAAEGSEIEDIYVAPEQLVDIFNQSALDPEQQKSISQALGPRLTSALEEGTDVRIPVAEFATYIAGTEAEKALLEHVKTDPHGMTKAEAEEFMATQGAKLQDEIAKAVDQAKLDSERDTAFETAKTAISAHLAAANRFSPQVNDQYATLIGSALATMAKRSGKSIEEILQQRLPRVETRGANGDALDQNGRTTEERRARAIEQGFLTGDKWKAITNAGRGQAGGRANPGADGRGSGGNVRADGLQREGLDSVAPGQIPGGDQGLGAVIPDTDGSGLVTLYHGTSDIVRGFDLNHPNRKDLGWLGDGVYLTDDPLLAKQYAERKAGNAAPNIMPLHVKLENPYVADLAFKQSMRWKSAEAIKAVTDELKAAGHDGVVLVYPDGTSEVAVFDPANVRSVHAQFDPSRAFENDLLAQRATQTNTPEFKAWFDDSKVVDENGAPLVVYHGTNQPLDEFSLDRGGRATGTNAGATQGFFFTDSAEEAGQYAENAGNTVPAGLAAFEAESARLQAEVARTEKAAQRTGDWAAYEAAMVAWEDHDIAATQADPIHGQNITPVYLSVQNPLIVDLKSGEFRGRDIEAYVAQAKAEGHDGVFLRNISDSPKGGILSNHYVVFEPTQIKSATGNNGQFDPNDPSILHQSENPIYWSPLERAVENMGFAKAPGQQWFATIAKTPGVKKEELEWTGLEEWLNAQDGPVSRDEVLSFVRAGGVQVDEVVLGEADEYAVDERAMELRDEWIQEHLNDYDPDVSVDYPDINVSEEDEDGNPIEWEVDGETFDSEEDAQAKADELHDEWRDAAEDEARRDHEEYLSDGAPYWDFENAAREELGAQTKFEQYTEKGGDDYRELLLTLPSGARGNPEKGYYHSGHFSDQPVIAHVRFKSRKSADGKDVMFIEEVQSDWHQQGREKGYGGLSAADQTEYDRLGAHLDALDLQHTVARLDLVAKWLDARRRNVEKRAAEIEAEWGAEDTAAKIANQKMREELAADEAKYAPDGRNRVARLAQADEIRFGYEREGNDDLAVKAGIAEIRAIDMERGATREEVRALEAKSRNAIPDAPFKNTTSWGALAMKRAIRWAADNGFDQIAWTTGEQQADRYSMSEAVEWVDITKRPAPNEDYVVQTKSNVKQLIIEQGLGEQGAGGINMTADQVRQVFGADLGGRLVTAADNSAPTAEDIAAGIEKANAAREKYTNALNDALTAEGDNGVDVDALRDAQDKAIRDLDKLYANPVSFEGEDLKLGGEGMKAFYDKMLPNITKDIIKKFGATVKPIAVEGMLADPSAETKAQIQEAVNASGGFTRMADSTPEEIRATWEAKRKELEDRIAGNLEGVKDWHKRVAEGGMTQEFRDQNIALVENRNAEYQATLDNTADIDAILTAVERFKQIRDEANRSRAGNLGFDITPELKAAAEQGFALFQKNLGAYSPQLNVIYLFENANLSTMLHESGHFFLELLHGLASEPGATQEIKDDWATTLKWFGVSAEAWQGMTLEQKRPHHEKWARGFEAYLFTGKAPSLRLQGAFSRFRSWLISVYKQVKALGVNVSPDVRGVMDRMLATDDQIAEMEAARSMVPLFENREASGMTVDQWREYQNQAQDATTEAVEQLQSRSLRDMRWLNNARSREINKLKKLAGAIRKKVRAEVAAEVANEPIYRARTFLTKGTLDGQQVEGAHRFSIPELEALYEGNPAIGAIKKALGFGQYGMLSAENGIHPEQVAELFGYTSADHLIRDLMAVEPMKDKIDALVEKRLLEEHGDLSDEAAIEEAANKAIHNEARAKFVATELAALEKATGKRKTLASAARQFAEATIARLKVRDLKPSLYEAAAARASKASQKAMASGNTLAAAAEKRNQLINTYASKAAIKAREEMGKAVEYFKRFDKPGAGKSIDSAYLQQIHALLEAVDLRKGTSLKQIDRLASLAEWIEKQRELGFEPAIPDDLLQQLGRKSYKEMTVEEVRGLVDAIKNIEHLGRLKNKLLTAKKDRDFGRAVDRAVDTIKTFATSSRELQLEPDATWIARAQKGVREFLALHRKFASMMRQMDGFKDGGALWELFVRPMNEAGDREASLRAEATRRLSEIMRPIIGDKAMSKKVYIPEIGASLTLQARIAIALNMGNSTNRERVLMGDNWNETQLDAVLASLTTEHWQVVQQIWDYVNSYWPQIAAKEQRVTGLVPEKVEAEPFEVMTADGDTLTLNGGYYPIKYDADRSTRAEADTAAEVAAQFTRGLYSRATTRRGHTKERANTVKRPVRKDLGVVLQHLSEVIHDLSWHEYLIDATRLVRAPGIDAAIREHYGPETLRAMRNALTDMAAGDIPAANVFEKSVNYLRTGATVAGMGWSMSTALLQPLGLAQSVRRIGAKWVWRGVSRIFADARAMESTSAWIMDQSEFMRTRNLTQQREISEIRNQIEDKNSPIRDSFFYLIAKFQLVADLPTWVGQYEKSIDAGEDHDRAVALADQAVLDSQGGGQVKDLAGVQRGGPLMKLWTNFYSYMNVTYNLVAESVGEAKLTGNNGRAFVDIMMVTVVPAVLSYVLRNALKGDLPDDEEGWAKALAKESLSSLFGTMVGLREIGAIIQSDGRAAAPAGIVIERFGKLYAQVEQGDLDAGLLKAANAAGGVLLHYPSAQVQRTTEGFIAIAEGQTYNPMALLLGPSKEAKR